MKYELWWFMLPNVLSLIDTALSALFQFNAKIRAAAADALKHSFFNSLGPGVHMLPDSEYIYEQSAHTQWDMGVDLM